MPTPPACLGMESESNNQYHQWSERWIIERDRPAGHARQEAWRSQAAIRHFRRTRKESTALARVERLGRSVPPLAARFPGQLHASSKTLC
jgi:hypothetical protein